MRCVVPDCKNDSRNNFKSEGITFHSFPMEPTMRKSWMDALDKPDWQPKERSTVCSEHFLPEDLYETPSGLRKVRVGAVPVINQVLNASCEFGEPATEKVCRMCLVISRRLFSIRKYNLEHAFQHLTGLSLNNEDGLPQKLCAECAIRLRNCDTFRQRSLQANTLMVNLLKTNEHLTTNTLKSICDIQVPRLEIKNFTPDHYDLTLEHTELNELHKLDIDLEIKSLDDDQLEIKNENENDEIFADDFSPKDEDNFSEPEKDDKAFDTDDSLPLEVAKKKKKKKKEILKEKKVKKIKSTEPKIDRRRKPFLNQDLNETLFTVTDLSVEEQLAEVLKRQDTDNYKHAIFKCIDCFKGFLDRDAYSSHIIRHTNECGEHRCDICKTHFKQSHALRKHVTAHHLQRFSCNNCPYVTTHRQTARLHERWHKGTKYQCPHCNLEFLKFTTYMGHVRIKHPSDCVCELCGYSFVSAKGIELHKKLKHRGEDATIPENGPYCELCDVRFVTQDAHRKHLSVSTRHSGAERENNKPTRGRKPRDQERENTKSKDTDDDDKRRTYPSQIRRSEGPISCEQCGMELEDSRAYHGHFRRMHPDKNRTNYPSMKSPCMCEVCGRIFQSYALLRDHNWVHTGERPFKCEQCGKTFRMKQRLVAHRRVHSAARTSYDCTVCGKHFTTHSNRQRHMFRGADQLRLHRLRQALHNSQQPTAAHVRKYRMKQRLVAHRRVHSAARTSYDCTVCGKHFTTHSNRQRHMFIHTGLKPFKCEMCGKGFKHASEKRAHVTYVHLKKPWPKRARSKRHRQGSPVQGSASEGDMLPVWPACDPKLTDINMMDDKPLYYR